MLCHGGIFLSRGLYLSWPKKHLTASVKAELKELREQAPLQFMKRVLDRNFGCGSVGFKFFEHHNPEIIPALLSDRSLKKVLLFRQNVLAIYTSRLVSKQTGRYGLRKGDKRNESPRVIFDAPKFIEFQHRYFSFCRSVVGELNRTGQSYYLIRYEDTNDISLLGNLAAFVGAK